MLISQNVESEKPDNNAKMNSVDLMNNAEEHKAKTSSLNAQKVKNINNLVLSQMCKDEKTTFCNHELKKHISILFIILFFFTLIGSGLVFSFITFTNKFNEGIVEQLILKNNTKTMEWWLDSPIQPQLKIHIFNYTNIDDFLSGRDKKIKLQDVGPYVYKEFAQRVNLTFTEDHKITFYDNKQLIFMPSLSRGRNESDIIRVPNIPLLAALAKAEHIDAFSSGAFNIILSTTKPKEFQDRTVEEYLFGNYIDPFIAMTPDIDPDRVGLLAGRKGISVDNLTVYTGEDTLDNLGRIHAMNGQTKLDIWESEDCNEIIGTDGSQFPPHLMNKEEELQIFVKSFCRPLKLKYDREVTVLNGIPAWRYKTPEGAFATSLKNPHNQCYCDANATKCFPDGIFDASKCVDGIPLLLSYPHFMEGDDSLFTYFEGLKPDRKLHETYADIHPRMAFPINGASRLQMNFRVTTRDIGLFIRESWYKKLPEDLILPLFWFEVTAGEIPPEFQTIVFHTTQSANATYLAIQYGSLIAGFVSLLLLMSTSYIYFNRLLKKEPEKGDIKDLAVSFQPSRSV